MTSWFRSVLILILYASVTATVSAQVPNNWGNIGPSKGAIAGGIAGGAAVIGLVLFLALRKAPSITGCILPVDGEVSLTDERDHRPYALIAESSDLKAGRRVRLRGKKIQRNDGRFTFRTKKIDHDYGNCGT
jgi:hypothetical protein